MPDEIALGMLKVLSNACDKSCYVSKGIRELENCKIGIGKYCCGKNNDGSLYINDENIGEAFELYLKKLNLI